MKLDEKLRSDGFEILPGVLRHAQCEELIQELTALTAAGGKSAGLRNILQRSDLISGLAASEHISSLLQARLDKPAFPVRALFFDKTQTANWRVSWHQDLTIAVAERIEIAGYTSWSLKAGVPHVEPPVEILEDILTLRLHLDECTRENGALHVIPGSHQLGKLSSQQIDVLATKQKEFACEVPKGGALLMRPLLLHASWPAKTPSHRRVIPIEYAAEDLPDGLCWHERRLQARA